MKIAISVLLMVVVLTLVESSMYDTKTHVDQLRLKRDLNDKSVQRDLGNGQRRYIRDVNEKQQEWQEMNKPWRTSTKECLLKQKMRVSLGIDDRITNHLLITGQRTIAKHHYLVIHWIDLTLFHNPVIHSLLKLHFSNLKLYLSNLKLYFSYLRLYFSNLNIYFSNNYFWYVLHIDHFHIFDF